jgi:hypothetical protein
MRGGMVASTQSRHDAIMLLFCPTEQEKIRKIRIIEIAK